MTPRIAFVGSCQVTGLSAATQALLPDAEVRHHHVGVTLPADAVRAAVAGSDVVVTSIGDRVAEGDLLGPRALAGIAGSVLFLPNFIFAGLQPDLTYILDGARLLPGPVGDYHSALVAAAFSLGIPQDGVARYFNAHVFASAGYLDAYPAARAATIAAFAPHGFDLERAFADWERRGDAFMHTINHPAIVVLARLATMALAKLGLVAADTAPPEGLGDALAWSVIVPVWPAIARRAGVGGSTEILAAADPGTDRAARVVSLDDYIARSWAIYRTADPTLFAQPAIAAAATGLRQALAAATYAPPVRSARSPSTM